MSVRLFSPSIASERLLADRRQFVLRAGGSALALAAGLTPRSAFAKDLTVGFIYVGPKDDYGYNQAHAEGAARPEGHGGHQDHRGGERPGDVDVQKTMERMIKLDGATLIFPT